MKKIIRSLFFLFIFSIFISSSVQAKGKLNITNWNVDCNVVEDGSLSIKEDISFKFSGKFNGVYRDIKLKDTSKISEMKIFENVDGKEVLLKKVDKANKGDTGVYEVNHPKENYSSIKIFSPSKNETKTFTLKYKVLNECTKYEDIGELFYKFIGKENKTPIDNLRINVALPKLASKDDVKIFAHGPLNGKINFTQDGKINIEVDNLNAEKFVEARILFPKEYIKNSLNYKDENAYSKIMEQELGYAKKVQDKIESDKKRSKMADYATFVIIGINILIILAISLRFKRKQKFNAENYYGMLPEECTPAVANVIFSRYLSTKDIIATMLDLARKGYLSIEKVDKNDSELTINKKVNKKKKDEKENYRITKIKTLDDNLMEHEKFFVNWLVDKVGDGNSVTLDEISYYSKKKTQQFMGDYNRWKKLIEKYVKDNKYFDDKAKKWGISLLVFSVFQLVISILFIVFRGEYAMISLFMGFALMVISVILMSRRSDYGYIQYKKWTVFRERLRKAKEYNIEKEFSEYSMDECLIYGISLGLSQKEINKFKPYIMSNSLYNNGYMYWYLMSSTSRNDNYFHKSINSAFGGTVPSTGSGGGFSGGGAGGAGGGGGAGGF